MGEGDCIEAVHQLYLYLDGELTVERRLLIRTHLDQCPPCLHLYDFEAELRLVISQKCRERVPEHLQAKVAEALRNLGEQPSP